MNASSAEAYRKYELSDDLARLCLPQEWKDPNRHLAWINSVCALFLAVGLVGLKPPPVIEKPINEPVEIVPVVFTPPEEQPQVKPEESQQQPDESQVEPTDMPQVVTIVAPANANVAFAVPVEGVPVAVASQVSMATPPPPAAVQSKPAAPPKQIKFNPDVATDGGSYPDPRYPQVALRNRYQGTVTLAIELDTNGAVTALKVQKTSGHNILDETAMDVVKNKWRFPPGEKRSYLWDCTFKIQ